jgi:hypothetical protein
LREDRGGQGEERDDECKDFHGPVRLEGKLSDEERSFRRLLRDLGTLHASLPAQFNVPDPGLPQKRSIDR